MSVGTSMTIGGGFHAANEEPRLIDALAQGNFKTHAQYEAHCKQINPDLAVLNNLTAVATALNGKVQVTGLEGHVVDVSLFNLIIADSGEGKSIGVKIARQPSNTWLHSEREKWMPALRRY